MAKRGSGTWKRNIARSRPGGKYYCNKCGRMHIYGSKIYDKHKKK